MWTVFRSCCMPVPADACSAFEFVYRTKMRRLRRIFRAVGEPSHWARVGYSGGARRKNDTFRVSGIMRRGTGTDQPQQAQGSCRPVHSPDEKLWSQGESGWIGI